MNFDELRNSFRSRIGDTKKPYLWSDHEVDGHINDALIEAVDRGLMIYDRESFTIDVEIGVAEYALDPSIIRIKEVRITSKEGVELDEPELLHLAERDFGYQFSKFFTSQNDAQGYYIDEDGLFVLASPPVVAAVLALVVYRYPRPLTDGNDEPEIPSIYHSPMLEWALKKAYLKQDADAYDPKASERHDAEFTRTFGPPKTAQQHRQRRRRAARSIKTPGF